MISVPDDLLARLDEQARRRGKTRSGFLRELAERELRTNSESRRREIASLIASAGHHGGRSAQHVHEQRRAR